MTNNEPVYIKLFLDDLDALEELSDAERGRLLTALLKYGRSGEAPRLTGNERILFPMFRARVDRDFATWREKSGNLHEARAEAGRKGGQARANKGKQSEANQANASKRKHITRTNDEDKDKDNDEDKDKDKDDKSGRRPQISPAADLSPSSPSPYDLDLGQVMSALLNFIPEAPQSALEQLRAYYETCGRDVCLRAIDIARGERKASWNYIAAILRNKSAAGIRTLADWDKAEQERRMNNARDGRTNSNAPGHGAGGYDAAFDSNAWRAEREADAQRAIAADAKWGIKSAF